MLQRVRRGALPCSKGLVTARTKRRRRKQGKGRGLLCEFVGSSQTQYIHEAGEDCQPFGRIHTYIIESTTSSLPAGLSSDKQKKIRLQKYNKTSLRAVGKHRLVIRNLQNRRSYHLGFMEDAGTEERHLQQCRWRHGRGCSATLQYAQLKRRTTVPLHLIWGTRLCQALFCKGGWIQGEFCLVLMEPLYNELANLQRRGINAPIKTNIDWISSHIKERKNLQEK